MKTMYVLLGAPGVGKSTSILTQSELIFGDDRLKNYILSPDVLRSIVSSPVLKVDGSVSITMSHEKYVWNIIREILDKKTQNGELIIMDATHSRIANIQLYKKYSDDGYRVVIVDYRDYCTFDEIISRNDNREVLKRVPHEAIKTIYERLNTLVIPNWLETIKPEEFKDHFNNLIMDFNNFDKLTFIGDIHNCSDELSDLISKIGVTPNDEKHAIVFVGDYFDRGPKSVQTFRMLQEISKNNWVLFLRGNHEKYLGAYKQFFMKIHEMTVDWIKNIFEKENELFDNIDSSVKNTIVKYPKTSYKNLDSFIENIKTEKIVFDKYKEFIDKIDFRTLNLSIKVPSISGRTLKQFLLSSITYREISQFNSKLAQLFYGEFNGTKILATHGGLCRLPDRTTPSFNLYNGVGLYKDSEECDSTFSKLHPDAISIHGHRNTKGVNIKNTPNTFNLNGDVGIGLRAISITKDSIMTYEAMPREDTLLFYREAQVKAAQRFKASKIDISKEKGTVIKQFQNHKYIKLQEQPDDIVSINFTEKAFRKGIWDSLTLRARGLFMGTSDNDENKVISRGYKKFFNFNDSNGYLKRDLKNLYYPLKVFEKANGFLGLLTVDNRTEHKKWFISSKSTTSGDYANNFGRLIKAFLTDELKQSIIDSNVTLVFEVIDPIFDPHIQRYKKEELVLLDAIHNSLSFSKVDYNELQGFVNLFSANEVIRVKKLLKECHSPQEFLDYRHELKNREVFDLEGTEGVVIEDSNPNCEERAIFKIKNAWYNFWKHQRSNMMRISSAYKNAINRGQTTLNKTEYNNLTRNLHTSNGIEFFNFLIEEFKTDFQNSSQRNIIEMREKFLQNIKETS